MNSFSNLTQVRSPNFDDRPDNAVIDLLVIHNISLPTGEYEHNYVEAFFCNQLDEDIHPYFKEISAIKVSSHLYIRRSGKLIQFVPLSKRAWHAGVSEWKGRAQCNDFSIGIELEGTDYEPFTDAQYESLIRVTRDLQRFYPGIRKSNIVGHSDIAPGRKTDPGPHFRWQQYLSALD